MGRDRYLQAHPSAAGKLLDQYHATGCVRLADF
jgi:hypothetical protein